MRILKTWKKFRKPGENFQKSFGHPGCNGKLLYFYLSLILNLYHLVLIEVRAEDDSRVAA